MPKRWEREQTIARQYMQNVRADTNFDLAGISGEIVLPNKYSAGIRDAFRVYIIYPSDFLHALTAEGFVDNAPTHPTVFLQSHHDVWVQDIDGHIMADWSLCLYVKGEVDINFRDFHSLERLLEIIKTFLMLERIYQRRLLREKATGVKATWPGPQRAHGFPGYIDAITERGGLRDDELCICGNGLRYGRCHKAILERYAELEREAA